MGNTEIIKLGDQEFKVFKRLPIPISREVQKLLLECAEDYDGPIEDLESGKVSPKDAKNINMDLFHEAFDLLLTKAVLDPKISKADIDNIDHDFQEYFEDLSEKLFEKWTDHKKSVKKKSMNSPS